MRESIDSHPISMQIQLPKLEFFCFPSKSEHQSCLHSFTRQKAIKKKWCNFTYTLLLGPPPSTWSFWVIQIFCLHPKYYLTTTLMDCHWSLCHQYQIKRRTVCLRASEEEEEEEEVPINLLEGPWKQEIL